MTQNKSESKNHNKQVEHVDNQQLQHAKWMFIIAIILFLAALGSLLFIHLSVVCLPAAGKVDTTPEVVTPPSKSQGAATPVPGKTPTSKPAEDDQQNEGPDLITKIFGECQKPPLQWLDWFLASMAGVLLYIIASLAFWYQKSARYYKYQQGSEPDFYAFTPWYISTVIKAPVIAFVVLVFLTNLNIDIAGLTLDFTELNAAMLLVIAFVLGFYSRVARKQLDHIVKAIFPKAYSQAEEEFYIVPGKTTVVFGQSVKFNTSEYTEVTWVAPVGSIDENGVYVAPATGDKDAVPNRVVNVSAVPKDPNIPRANATVTLIPFNISGDTKIAYEETKVYQVDPDQKPDKADDSGVSWAVSPKIDGAKVVDKKGNLEYTAPSKEKAEEAKVKSIIITAKSIEHADSQVSMEIEFKQKEEPES